MRRLEQIPTHVHYQTVQVLVPITRLFLFFILVFVLSFFLDNSSYNAQRIPRKLANHLTHLPIRIYPNILHIRRVKNDLINTLNARK